MADVETGIVDTDDFLAEAKEAFCRARDIDSENRLLQEEDLRFVWLREQWPLEVIDKRRREGRPCLTLDKTQAFVRQVVNDARMNKPQIKVKPVDSGSDPDTAEIIAGLIRNIEYASDSDIAYDTAMRDSVSSGRGYFKINTRYATDDTFDQDIVFERVADPLTIWGDPASVAADSSDWNEAWEIEPMTKEQYEKAYPGEEVVSFSDFESMDDPWWDGDRVLICRYWRRELVASEALMVLLAGEIEPQVVEASVYEGNREAFEQAGAQILARRPIQRHEVKCHILSGAQVLETINWPGSYIPIVPVYGDEVTVDGKRWFSSLIRPAMDAQRNYNYWRSTTTELVALAPKAPFIGPEEAFQGDDEHKWATANQESWSYIGYKGQTAPQRQPFAGVPAGALQEALNASDDMKATLGIYDASLGARSNETSGRAIMARQREGDVSTFHFIDNLSRAIKHAGRILVDLIPHVYSSARMIRILGPEGEPQTVPVAPEEQQQMFMARLMQRQEEVAETLKVYDLSRGKYDVAVETGPSFTTQREEGREALIELTRSFPQAAPVLADLILKMFDFPGAEEAAERISQIQQQGQQQGPDPAKVAEFEQKQQETALKAQESAVAAQQEAEKLRIDAFRAETERMKVMHELRQPAQAPRMDYPQN